MRIVFVLAIAIAALLAFGVACEDEEKGAPMTPSPVSESEGEVEEGWDEGEPLPARLLDSDDDGFIDISEERYGSDSSDDASVPESEDANPDSCTDGVDNDLDGDTDDADDGCPLAGLHVVSANLGVTHRDYVGPCPVRFTFSGSITLEAGSGTVLYQLVRSDGGSTPSEALTFDSPGTQDVDFSVLMGFSQSGWAAIRILLPEEHESNRVDYTLTCED